MGWTKAKDMESHRKVCPNRFVDCRWCCGISQLRAAEQRNHELYDCPNRDVYCDWNTRSNKSLGGCGTILQAAHRPLHQTYDCPQRDGVLDIGAGLDIGECGTIPIRERHLRSGQPVAMPRD